jgi:hypothetical protein
MDEQSVYPESVEGNSEKSICRGEKVPGPSQISSRCPRNCAREEWYITEARTAFRMRANVKSEVLVRFGPFLGLAVLLIIIWVVSFVVYHVVGAVIHLLLLVAVVFLILQLFSGRKR